MEKENNEAYMEGRIAYARGLDRRGNPYRCSTGARCDDARYDYWLDGWLDAQWDSGDQI